MNEPVSALSAPTTGRGAPRPARWRALLIAIVVLGQLAAAMSPSIYRQFGLEDFGMWFLDSYAILAAGDAAQAGIDPYQAIPGDPLNRLHSYSRWWLVLGDWGLTREDNFAVGGAVVLAFWVALFWWLRPRSGAETVWLAALGLSPPLLLLTNRANNDAVVFLLVLASFVAVARWKIPGLVLALALLFLATGLKFYPLVLVAPFLLLRPSRRLLVGTLGAAAVCGLAYFLVRADFGRASLPTSHPLCTFGADVLGHALGWTPQTGTVVGVLVLVMAGAALRALRVTRGLADDTAPLEARLLFAAGATLLVACFVARINYAYRWIFLFLLAPWLWSQRSSAGRAGRAARFAVIAIVVAVWMDALFCWIGNGLFGPFQSAEAALITRRWLVATQPLVWALLSLLTGWLWDLPVAAWRTLRGPGGSAASLAAR